MSSGTIAPEGAADGSGARSHVDRPLGPAASSLELVLHLSGRQLRSTHRRTVLGWSWPLVMQLIQLGVFVFVFKKVVELEIDNYPTFVFTGLAFWAFFSSGTIGAAGSVTANPALVLEPRMRAWVLPVMSIVVVAFDLAVAMGVLAVLVTITEGMTLAALMVPVLLAVQIVLMIGVGLLLAALHVRHRDVQPLAGAILLVLFYLTPIFYSVDLIPERFRWIVDVNPMGTLVTGYHSVLLDGELPAAGPLVAVAAVAVAVLAAGVVVFRRLSPSFADDL